VFFLIHEQPNVVIINYGFLSSIAVVISGVGGVNIFSDDNEPLLEIWGALLEI
jgi:hypothetical protein